MDKFCITIGHITQLPYILTNEILGEGKSSVVYKGFNLKTKESVAIKRVPHFKSSGHDIYLEALLLKTMNHRNIPKFYGFYKDYEYYYIILEYIDGMDLIDYLSEYGKLKMDKVKYFSRQLVDVVKYLHNNNIIHRDIKLENIILEKKSNRLLIIDFGFGGKISYDSYGEEKPFSNFCGSALYAAPEIWENRAYYGKPVDIWSLGISIFVLALGYFPYDGEDDEIFDMIMANKLKFPDNIPIPKDLENFLKSMLTIDSDARVNINSLSRSPWIKNKK